MRKAVGRALVLAVLATAPVHAQGATRCIAENTDTTRQLGIKLPSGQYNFFWGAGIVVRCPAKQIVLRADSAEQYGDEKRIFLLGHVFYDEPRFSVRSDFLTYFTADERVVASGNVHAKMPSGSTLLGPQATYLRAAPRVRPRAQLTAIGRPTINIVERDSAGKPMPPMEVIANTVFMDGDSLVYAGGDVQIHREQFAAQGDSAFLDGTKETMRLMRNPKISGQRGRPFTLVGDLIDMFSQQRKLRRVLSRGHAVATSQEMVLNADTIDLRVDNDELERAMAWGPGRAHAKSPTQSLLSDSIVVEMPHQRVREIHALRKAYAEGKPDTLKFRTGEMDWLRGDTVIAYFDTMPPRDTTQGIRIRQLVAFDSARAYYHLPPADSSCRIAAINYIIGDSIFVNFDGQRVQNVSARGHTDGRYAEPDSLCQAAARARADSARAHGDSAKARPDTVKGAVKKPGSGAPSSPPAPRKPPTASLYTLAEPRRE
ncbi:MAG TPA: hypothetical protein VG818_14205 [Gemmatimonadaceae bacterium]|nr:hypothetical protein [Gemmatimonadaceae bacterium]